LLTGIGPDTWPVKVDVNELELAIVNVVLNARDAMPQGGTITLTAENVLLAASDTAAEIEGEYVALRIGDTGSGIAPDVLPNVFDPFFTTKSGAKGSGLGLSQVHGFSHQSGGTVTISSELGRGTTVTIYLPRSRETASEAKSEQGVETAAADGSVLLVEDHPDVAEATASMLEQLGYRVQMVSNPAAALEAIS